MQITSSGGIRETGETLKYGIEALRNEPGRFKKWYLTRHGAQQQNSDNITEWGKIEPQPQQGLKECYQQKNRHK